MKCVVTPDRLPLIRRRRRAMGAGFEVFLQGDDPEHLEAVGEAILDEVCRVDALLSRFNPASEISRVNRAAGGDPVKVDREVFSVLEECESWRVRTGGCFDILAVSLRDGKGGRRRDADAGSLVLDPAERTVGIPDSRRFVDLGGYGKGYALDLAARLLDEFGITNALVSGGASSVLTRGRGPGGLGWPVGIRNPSADDPRSEVERIRLGNVALSSSAVGGSSNVIDPRSGVLLEGACACTVLAENAAVAEAVSTALLVMGASDPLSGSRGHGCPRFEGGFMEGADDSSVPHLDNDPAWTAGPGSVDSAAGIRSGQCPTFRVTESDQARPWLRDFQDLAEDAPVKAACWIEVESGTTHVEWLFGRSGEDDSESRHRGI